MWDSQTKIVDRAGVSADKGQYLEKLLLEYSIPKKGVVIILDNEDYVDYFNPIWRNQGLHLSIRLGGIEEMSPEYLLKIMESNKYSNLVWISKRINTGDAIKFVWVASHEFQHLKQDAISHNLSVWARYNPPFTPWFLRRNEILIPVSTGADTENAQ